MEKGLVVGREAEWDGVETEGEKWGWEGMWEFGKDIYNG